MVTARVMELLGMRRNGRGLTKLVMPVGIPLRIEAEEGMPAKAAKSGMFSIRKAVWQRARDRRALGDAHDCSRRRIVQT